MKIVKYTKAVAASSSGGSSGGSSSTSIERIDRIIWGQNDRGEDIDGSMVVNGNISIKQIIPLPDDEEDEDDYSGEYEEYEEGGGNLDVELKITANEIESKDMYASSHLYINYPQHPEHPEDNKKCIGEIIKSVEDEVNANSDKIKANTDKISSNETAIKNNSDEIEKLKQKTDATQTAVNDLMPIGSIIMFNGEASKIPDNWAICDGSKGTPNLIDRFIKASLKAGEVGGHNTITLSEDNMPTHKHIVRSYLTQVNGNGEINTGIIEVDGEEVVVGYASRSADPSRRAQTDSSGHSDIPYIQHSTFEAGNDNPLGFDIQPSYYSLIYIMKIK